VTGHPLLLLLLDQLLMPLLLLQLRCHCVQQGDGCLSLSCHGGVLLFSGTYLRAFNLTEAIGCFRRRLRLSIAH